MRHDTEDRVKKLHRIMETKQLNMLVLTDGYNIHFISGYRGHTGCLVIMEKDQYILTDSRYTEQVSLEAPDFQCVDIGKKGYAATMACLLAEHEDMSHCRAGFENKTISYNQYRAFEKAFGDAVELIPLENMVDQLRQIKTPYELDRISRAESIGDEAFSYICHYIKVGMTEMDVALALEYTMRKAGASGLSFDTIAASGPNGSLPHAVPTSRRLENGDFLTMDFGCIYDGYCSDMTRTVFVGDVPSSKQLTVYNTVLKAQQEAMKLIRPGAKCSDVDACARKIILDAGYGQYFGHGLGHSVGLYIHEEPRLSGSCDAILEPGMTMTVEPGIYLPGEFGVRIEDLVVVTEDGYHNLTRSSKELIML